MQCKGPLRACHTAQSHMTMPMPCGVSLKIQSEGQLGRNAVRF